MDFYFDCYGELCLQRTMVADRPRTDAFAAAIKEVVRAGDRIIDVGTGSGLLAMLAARAGAERVYALDQASVLEVAEQVVRANGLADQVEAVRCNARDFQLAEPADLMISEWLGHFGFAEAMFQDVMRCRVDNLRKGGRMLPSGIELKIAPVESEALYDEDGPGFWRKEVHGVDFSLLERLELEQGVALKTNIYPEDLLAPGEVILDLDLAEADEDSPWQSGEVAFVLERSGRLDGFAGWFAAQLSPSVKLDTAPGAPLTHWQQTYFPFYYLYIYIYI